MNRIQRVCSSVNTRWIHQKHCWNTTLNNSEKDEPLIEISIDDRQFGIELLEVFLTLAGKVTN